jgi:hypothetical protein
MPWKRRPPGPLEKENAALKTTIIVLRRELENRDGMVGRLELLLHERCAMIDALHSRIDTLRGQVKQLETEADHYCRMIALS